MELLDPTPVSPLPGASQTPLRPEPEATTLDPAEALPAPAAPPLRKEAQFRFRLSAVSEATRRDA